MYGGMQQIKEHQGIRRPPQVRSEEPRTWLAQERLRPRGHYDQQDTKALSLVDCSHL